MAVIDVHITQKNGTFVPSQDPVTLSKSHGDTIKWHNDTNEDLTISFDNGTPFPGNRNPYHPKAGKPEESGNIQVNAGTTWSYNIASASGAIADPQIIIQQ